MRRLLLLLLIVLALVGGGYYLWSSGLIDFSALMGRGETTTETEEPAGGKETEEVVEVSVGAKEFSFTPSKITVDAGSKVRLTLENSGNVSHDFVIDELDVTTTLVSPGDSETIDFTVSKAGSYEFYCSIPGHKEAGMAGTLVVK